MSNFELNVGANWSEWTAAEKRAMAESVADARILAAELERIQASTASAGSARGAPQSIAAAGTRAQSAVEAGVGSGVYTTQQAAQIRELMKLMVQDALQGVKEGVAAARGQRAAVAGAISSQANLPKARGGDPALLGALPAETDIRALDQLLSDREKLDAAIDRYSRGAVLQRRAGLEFGIGAEQGFAADTEAPPLRTDLTHLRNDRDVREQADVAATTSQAQNEAKGELASLKRINKIAADRVELDARNLSEEAKLQVQKLEYQRQVNRLAQQQIDEQIAQGKIGAGTRFQQFQANLASREGGAPKLPEQYSTLGQTIGSRFATTAGFAVSGLATYGAVTALRDIYKSEQDVQQAFVAVDGQMTALGQNAGIRDLHRDIGQIATDTATAEATIATVFPQIRGIFSTTADALTNIKTAALLAKGTGLDLNTLVGYLVPAATAFGTSFATIADSAVGIRDRAGVSIAKTVEFIGAVGPVAAQAGLSVQQAMAIGTAALQDTSRAATNVAEDFNRIIPAIQSKAAKVAGDLVLGGAPQAAVGQFDQAVAAGKTGDALIVLAQNYASLTQQKKEAIVEDLGGTRAAKDLIASFQNQAVMMQALAAANSDTGKSASYFAQVQHTLGFELQKLQQELLAAGRALLQSGIATGFSDIVVVLTEAITIVRDVANAFVFLNDHLGHSGSRILEVLAAAKALQVALRLLTSDTVINVVASIPGLGGLKRPSAPSGEEASAQIQIDAATRAAEITIAAAERQAAILTGAGDTAGEAMAAGGEAGGEAEAAGGAAGGAGAGAGAGAAAAGFLDPLFLIPAGVLIASQALSSAETRWRKAADNYAASLSTVPAAALEAEAAKKPSFGERLKAELSGSQTKPAAAAGQEALRADPTVQPDIAALAGLKGGVALTGPQAKAVDAPIDKLGLTDLESNISDDLLGHRKISQGNLTKLAKSIAKGNKTDIALGEALLKVLQGDPKGQAELADALAAAKASSVAASTAAAAAKAAPLGPTSDAATIAAKDQQEKDKADLLSAATTDPIALAKIAQDLADQQLADATNVGDNSTGQIDKANAAKAKADQAVIVALQNSSVAKLTLTQSIDKDAGNTVKAAYDQVDIDQQEIDNAVANKAGADAVAALVEKKAADKAAADKAAADAQVALNSARAKVTVAQQTARGDTFGADQTNIADTLSQLDAARTYAKAHPDDQAAAKAVKDLEAQWIAQSAQGLKDSVALQQAPLDLLQAQQTAAGDTVGAAKTGQQKAAVAVAAAKGPIERANALVAQIQADKTARDAVQSLADAEANVVIATANAAGDTVTAANKALQDAEDKRARDLAASGGVETPGTQTDLADVISKAAAARDAKLQNQLALIDYEQQMGQITVGQEVAQLNAIIAAGGLTVEETRSLQEKVHGLLQQAGQNLAFNLSDITLPTLYEVHRLNKTPSGSTYTPVDQRQMNFYFNVSGATLDQVTRTVAGAIAQGGLVHSDGVPAW